MFCGLLTASKTASALFARSFYISTISIESLNKSTSTHTDTQQEKEVIQAATGGLIFTSIGDKIKRHNITACSLQAMPLEILHEKNYQHRYDTSKHQRVIGTVGKMTLATTDQQARI